MPKLNPISRLSERNQMLVLSVAVGLVVGLAAVLLKTLISIIQLGLALRLRRKREYKEYKEYKECRTEAFVLHYLALLRTPQHSFSSN